MPCGRELTIIVVNCQLRWRELSYGRELTIIVVNCQLRWRELSFGRELQPAVALWLLFINFSATQNFVLLFTPLRGISRRSHFTKTMGFQFTPHNGISRRSHFTKTMGFQFTPHSGISRRSHFTKTVGFQFTRLTFFTQKRGCSRKNRHTGVKFYRQIKLQKANKCSYFIQKVALVP